MNAPTSLHPTDQTLHAYAMGKLDDASAESINSHLEGCTDCRRRTSEVASDSFLGRFQGGRSAIGRSAPLRSPVAPTPVGAVPPELAGHKDYEVVRELGRGGMGVVYLVSNRLMGRNEVLKVMGRHLVEHPEVSERFLREIRAVASLRHPNIVAAHHAFHVGESIAFTMEYVEGYDLSKMVKSRGPLPVAHACLFAHQAAQGLQHAHEEGMVHRDIKPGNLMVSRRGDKAVIKILDFGLAKAAREGQFDGALTHAGQMLGTPDFIAPEQIRDAQSAGIGADIYSLGCTLYYLLTGGPPFSATSLYDLLQAHHSMDARLLNFARPEVPTELAALVAKMMAKEPERRFKTPADVSAALVPFFKKGGVTLGAAAPDISQVGPAEARRATSASEPAPTEPGTSTLAAPGPRTLRDAERPEAMWTSLIDFREPEPKSVTAEPSVEESPRRRWLRPVVAAGVLLFGAAAVWMGGVFRVETEYGTIVVENPPPGAEILVDRKGVTMTPSDGGKPLKITVQAVPHDVRVPIGKHTLVVRRGDVVLTSRDVTLESAGQEPIRIRLEEPTGPRRATLAQDVKESEFKRTGSGLEYKDTKVGTGPFPQKGQTCKVHYTGWLYENGKVGEKFDSSADTGRPFSFPIGAGRVIQGWDEGVVSMKVGGKRTLIISPGLAYGPRGAGGVIPPNAALIFDIELLGVDPADGPGIVTGAIGKQAEKRGQEPISAQSQRSASGPFSPAEPPVPPAVSTGTIPAAPSPPKSKTNSIGMNLVLIPAGEFLMGSPENDKDAKGDEKPPHSVQITRPFYLGRYEVTRGQFRRFVEATGYRTEAEADGKGGFGWDEKTRRYMGDPRFTWKNPGFEQTAEHPVVSVSWNDAVAFTRWLGRKEGKNYRLPTEAEWEYACRARSTTRYSFGDDPEGLVRVGNVMDVTAREKNPEWTRTISGRDGHVYTSPVGRFKANEFGLHDMHGNVLEWCSDGYDAGYYRTSPVADPPGAREAQLRVFRGGAWNSEPTGPFALARSAARRLTSPIARGSDVGFRVVLDLGAEVRDLSGIAPEGSRRPAPPAAVRSPSRKVVVLDGIWRAEGEELVQSGGHGAILLGDAPWPSFDLRFKAKITSGGEGFVALFHRTNRDNFRFFHVGEERQKTVGSGFMHRGEEGGQDRAVPTVLGRWYDVRVKVRGAEFWCYLDGQEWFHDVDPRFTQGNVGLATWDADARYRDIVITDPEGRPLWEGPPAIVPAAGGAGGSPTSAPRPPTAPVGEPPAPPASEKGTKPVPLTELNTPGIDADAWVSPDGLQIYWTSEPAGASGKRDAFAIYRAERPDPGSPFGAKRLVIQNGQHPTLTPDQLQIVYLQDAGPKYKQIVVRSRPSVRDPFGPASSPGDFGPYVAYNSPAISADGLSLTVNAKATDDILSTVYLTSRRKTMKDAWPKPEVLNISWDTRAEKAPLSWIAMATDELSFLATHELELGRFRVVRFSRDRISEPFRRFRYLTLPDGNPIYGRSPRYIAATDELYLTALPVYAQSAGRELWAKTKPDLWVIRDFGQGQGWASDN